VWYDTQALHYALFAGDRDYVLLGDRLAADAHAPMLGPVEKGPSMAFPTGSQTAGSS